MGIKTSEFYLALVMGLSGLGAGLFGVDGGVIASALLPSVTYIGGRSYIKGQQDV